MGRFGGEDCIVGVGCEFDFVNLDFGMCLLKGITLLHGEVITRHMLTTLVIGPEPCLGSGLEHVWKTA